MKITPKRIQQKISKKRDPFLSIQDENGKWYSCWKQDLFSIFIEGAEIDVEIEKRGDFKNIVEVSIPQSHPSGATATPIDPQFTPEPPERNDIAFSKAVDVAIAMYQQGAIGSEQINETVKTIYPIFKKML